MEKLPKILRSLEGDQALKVQSCEGRFTIIDLKTIHGVIELHKKNLDDDEQDIKSLIMTGWGVLKTTHPLFELEDLLYPLEKEIYD